MPSLPIPPHANTVFQCWHAALSPTEKLAFAKRLNISHGMVRANYLIPIRQPLLTMSMYKKRTRGNPTHEDRLKIAEATQGACSLDDIIDHFVPRENEQ